MPIKPVHSFWWDDGFDILNTLSESQKQSYLNLVEQLEMLALTIGIPRPIKEQVSKSR